MLRAFINIAISGILLITTTGFTISEHYCGDKLISVSINHEAKSCCNMVGCCHNSSVHYQLKNDYSASVNPPDIQEPVTDIQVNSILFNINFDWVEPINVISPVAESPPPLKTHTILSLLQTFLC